MRPDHLVINLAKDVQNKTNVNINHLAMECYDFTANGAINSIIDQYANGERTLVFSSTRDQCHNILNQI